MGQTRWGRIDLVYATPVIFWWSWFTGASDLQPGWLTQQHSIKRYIDCEVASFYDCRRWASLQIFFHTLCSSGNHCRVFLASALFLPVTAVPLNSEILMCLALCSSEWSHQAHHRHGDPVISPGDHGTERLHHLCDLPSRSLQDTGHQASVPGHDHQEPQKVLQLWGGWSQLFPRIRVYCNNPICSTVTQVKENHILFPGRWQTNSVSNYDGRWAAILQLWIAVLFLNGLWVIHLHWPVRTDSQSREHQTSSHSHIVSK